MSSSKASRFLIILPLALVSVSAVTGQPVPAPIVGDEAPVAAASATVDDFSAPASAAPIMSLELLGFDDGIAFSELDGRTDLHFRVPLGNWLQGARLVLPYRAWAARPTPRTVTILLGERVLGQFPIENGVGLIEMPIPATALVGGGLPISLVYSGGLTPDRCADGRIAADHLFFYPTGGLALDPQPASVVPVAASIATLGMSPAILIPANPTPEQVAAALTIVAARGNSTISSAPDNSAGAIRIVGSDQPAVRSLGLSQLAIGGRDPAGAARAILGGVAYFPDTAVIDRITVKEPERADLTLADLGASTSTVSVNQGHAWTVPLPASRIPDGRSIRGLSVDVASVANASADRVSAWLNGMMLGSVPIHASGITHLEVRARGELTSAMNSVTVRIDRPAQGDCGDAHLAMPAQLLASSKVDLGKTEAIEDFHDFASASASGVTVVLPNADLVPLAARAIAGLISVNVPIRVSFGLIPKQGPVILIAGQPPSGTTPPLQLLNGRMVLASSESGAQLDIPQSTADTVVQLLEAESRPLLWIRPAPSGAVPATLWLNQGDVAIVNPAGTVQAFSTSRPRLAAPVEIEPPSWWDRNGWKIYLAVGLVLGLGLILWSLRPSVKRAPPGQSN